MQRWIIHIDMDAFFAAVEQRDNPQLRGQPVIVGGQSGRGVVSTASYEARKFGVHSAMPMAEARRRCPQGFFLAGDHRKYRQVSSEIRRILEQYSPVIEPLSLDEAFLDVTGMEWMYPNPVDMAKGIKEKIKAELDLIASAGVAKNKFLAKLASDWGKPDGLVVVEIGQEVDFLQDIPISRLWGVGEKTGVLLKKRGINTIGQLAQAPDPVFHQCFGNGALDVRRLCWGEDDRPVMAERAAKSIGNEVTFEQDLSDTEEMLTCLMALSQKVGRRLRKAGATGRTVTVKIRFASFKTITRSQALGDCSALDDTLYKTVKDILAGVDLPEGVRLLGVTVSNLHFGNREQSLFASDYEKSNRVIEIVDQLQDKFGEGVVTRGRLLQQPRD
jgi:DNA polymerase-4